MMSCMHACIMYGKMRHRVLITDREIIYMVLNMSSHIEAVGERSHFSVNFLKRLVSIAFYSEFCLAVCTNDLRQNSMDIKAMKGGEIRG